MQLKKLSHAFYSANTHLKQALDNIDGHWSDGKTRGYGVVVISINQLTFAIPLRSNIRHRAAYLTVRSRQQGILGKGLDFSKALLIHKPEYVSDSLFKIAPAEHTKLKNKALHIQAKFEKYVERYIAAMKKGDQNVLNNPEYRFSTLCNYHNELHITDQG